MEDELSNRSPQKKSKSCFDMNLVVSTFKFFDRDDGVFLLSLLRASEESPISLDHKEDLLLNESIKDRLLIRYKHYNTVP